MTAHVTRAVRRNQAGRIWFAVCSDGCVLPSVASKEAAEWEATKHRIRFVVSTMHCTCEYDPVSMEYGPNWVPCPKHAIIDALDAA